MKLIIWYCHSTDSRCTRAGLKPGDIKTIGDLNKIPFVTKQEVGDGEEA
ncbi:MAG: hypothetical protein HA496_02945 [Thaumarchaeota archaeon]|nr:hypothetical protein [Nitrososphaerota archaeon]